MQKHVTEDVADAYVADSGLCKDAHHHMHVLCTSFYGGRRDLSVWTAMNTRACATTG